MLDGMHRLMNGGEDLWPLQQCLNTSGSNESRVKLQAITGMQSFTADIKYTPPGTKEGKKLLPYKKIINVLIIKIQTKLSALSVFTT